jgi:hypothetical protein
MTTDEPAVNGWQAATEAHMAASTSAIGRDLQTQLDRLREEYNAVLLERDTIRQAAERNVQRLEYARGELNKALHANTRLGLDLVAAIIANDRLTRENERLRQAPWTGGQADIDAAKLIGEAIQAGSDG